MKLFAQITKPQNGYKVDQEMCEEHIEIWGPDFLYEVDYVNIGRSSTEVKLIDMRWTFNSVNLSLFVSEDGKSIKEYDVFKNELNLPQVHQTYVNMLLK